MDDWIFSRFHTQLPHNLFFAVGSIPCWISHLFFISIKMIKHEEFCDYHELPLFFSHECPKSDSIHSNSVILFMIECPIQLIA